MPNQDNSRHPDQRLVEGTLQGDPGATEQLIERLGCIPAILQARNQRLGLPFSDDDVAELTQETLALVWRKLATYEGLASLETWAYSYCNLQMCAALRNRRRRPLTGTSALIEAESVAERPLPDILERDLVLNCLEQLAPAQARVVRMKHFDQLTFEAIGRELRMSANTAKTHYYRGLERLRSLLERSYRESLA